MTLGYAIRAAVWVGLMLCGPSALATTVLQVGIEQQAQDSTAVVLARVGAVDPITTPTRAYIDTRLNVRSVLAGEAPAVLNIRQVGGEHQGRTVFVPGDGRLVPNTDVVAFIRKVEGQWYLTAMAQSVWTVEGEGRKARVSRSMDGAGLKARALDGSIVDADQSLPEPKTLEELTLAVSQLQMGQPQ